MQKKLLASFVGIILSFTTVFATVDDRKKDSYFNFSSTDLKFNIAVGMNSGDGFEPYRFMMQPYFQIDNKYLQAYAGIQAANEMWHATAGAVAWPLRWNRIRLGAGLIYHFNYFEDISLCHDLMLNIHFETRPAYWLGIKLNTGYFHKARKIFAVEDYVGYIENNSVDFSLETDFYLPYNITMYTRVSSYELFRYMVFCAPSFTFGVSKSLGKRVDLTFETTTRYIDFFTVSARYDDSEMRFVMGFHL